MGDSPFGRGRELQAAPLADAEPPQRAGGYPPSSRRRGGDDAWRLRGKLLASLSRLCLRSQEDKACEHSSTSQCCLGEITRWVASPPTERRRTIVWARRCRDPSMNRKRPTDHLLATGAAPAGMACGVRRGGDASAQTHANGTDPVGAQSTTSAALISLPHQNALVNGF